MNAPAKAATLSRITACTDCAHHHPALDKFEVPRCGRSIKFDPVTGDSGHFSCTNEREYEVEGGCGPKALHFLPTEAFLAARSVRRLQRQQQLVDAIEQHNPDVMDAQELLAAITSSLSFRYEDRAVAAIEVAKEFREALEELERTL